MEIDIEFCRKQFYQEAKDLLEKANTDLLKAEVDPKNSDLLNSIFRCIHTIKGSAGGFDLDAVSQFAHHLEGLLDAVREGKIDLNSELIDISLSACDSLLGMLYSYERGEVPQEDKEIIFKIHSFLDNIPSVSQQLQSEKHENNNEGMEPFDASPLVIEALSNALKKEYRAFEIIVKYSEDSLENGYDPQVFLRNIQEASVYYSAIANIDSFPGLDSFNPLHLYLHPTLYIATELSREEIEGLALDPESVEIRQIQADRNYLGNIQEELWENVEEIDDDIFDEFILPAKEGLDTAESVVLKYERDGNQESLDQIFRLVHTIKGDSGYLGFSNLTRVLHDLEFILEGLKRNNYQWSGRTSEVVLKSIDSLRQIINKLGERNGPVNLSDIYFTIQKHLKVLRMDHAQNFVPITELIPDKDERSIFMEQITQYREMFSNDPFSLDSNARQAVVRGLEGLRQAAKYAKVDSLLSLAVRALSALEESASDEYVKTRDEINAIICQYEEDHLDIGELWIECSKNTDAGSSEIISANNDVSRYDDDPGSGDGASSDRPTRSEITEKQSEITTMRIDERKIEEFSKIIGELVIARNTYEYLVQQTAASSNVKPIHIKAFKENLHLLSRLTNEIQMGVMSMWMVPIKGIFQKYQRVIRDIARKQKKEIQLITIGDDIEVDKKVADMLSDPLVHLVRNACDHGIEPLDIRRKSGKPELGTVNLSAAQEGRNLIIKITDDGKGLNRQRIYDKAMAMGFDVSSPYDDDIFNMIFMPGLSTKSEVSDVSGRGVGMDVVKSVIESLGGNVYVNSEEGIGTEITLTIPMAMGITNALLVEAGKIHYALPMDSVLETVKVTTENISGIMDGWGMNYRGNVLPVKHLQDILKDNSSVLDEVMNNACNSETKKTSDDELPIIVLRTNQGNIGLMIDHLKRNTEIAIKPLPPQLASLSILSGVSIMGNGQVTLVLNPESLV